MPRLADPDPNAIPADVRDVLSALPPDPMVKMLTHSVGTVNLFIQLARAQFTSLELPARSRELVILTVAEYAGCEFVAAQHRPMSEAAGVDQRTREIISSRDIDNPDLRRTTGRSSGSPPRWCGHRAFPTSSSTRPGRSSASARSSRCSR